MLERLVGPETASAMLLFGQVVDADTAVRIGLAWGVVDDAVLLASALAFASKACKASTTLLQDMKNTLRTTPRLPTRDEALRIETTRQIDSLRRPEAVDLIQRMRESLAR
jgi:enoyl-CoA hydratase